MNIQFNDNGINSTADITGVKSMTSGFSATLDKPSVLINNGWKVQSNVQQDKAILQAQKFGILRGLIAADRALTFVSSTLSFLNISMDFKLKHPIKAMSY